MEARYPTFRPKRDVNELPEQIQPGMALPNIEVDALLFDVAEPGEVVEPAPGQPGVPTAVVPVPQALGAGTTLLVGMPGAFTPTCNDRHLPGFIERSQDLAAVGVKRIAVLTTNDRYVNSAWNKAVEKCMSTKSPLLMLSDADGDLCKEMGLVDDMGFGLGIRSKRFVLVVQDGTVKHVAVDEGPDDMESTSAESILDYLAPKKSNMPSMSTPKLPGLDDTASNAILIGGALLLVIGAFLSSAGQ